LRKLMRDSFGLPRLSMTMTSSRLSGFSNLCRSALMAAALLTVAGCGSVNALLEGDKLDYVSGSKSNANPLEIPPGLSTLPRDDRFAVPERNSTATLSSYNLQRGTNAPATVSPMLPTVPDARLERAGSQRWLVVNKTPEEIWPVIKDFWQDMGFLVNIESQETGILETDWAENRAKIPQDFIRNTVGRLLDSIFSTGERDKFRTRLERVGPNSTEIYLSHRGMVELANAAGDSTAWQPRPSDPELEADFLRRLLLRFGVESERARSVVALAAEPARAQLVKAANGAGHVRVDESFDRAWRRVGLALDRVGFTVEDRDRTQGVYFVRYVDPEADNKSKGGGLLTRLFGFGGNTAAARQAVQYRIAVKEQGANVTHVSVQTREGAPETTDVGPRILNLLQEQLK